MTRRMTRINSLTSTCAAALLVASLTAPAVARADDDAGPSPLRARIELGEAGRSGPVEDGRVRLGQTPRIRVICENPTAAPIGLQGPLGGSDWTLGRHGQLLITGPDGERRIVEPSLADCSTDARKPLAPGESRTAHLWLARFVALTEPGTWEIAARFLDDQGRVVTTDPVRFEIDAPKAVAKAGLVVSIESKGDGSSSSLPPVEVTFENRGESPVTFVKPLDGSLWGWLEPHYWFVVRDETGRIVPPGSRCGNHGGAYTEETMVELAPGQKHVIETYLPAQGLDGGRHTVSLYYIMSARPAGRNAPGGFPPAEGKGGDLPGSAKHLVLGAVKSNELVLEIEGPRPRAWLAGPLDEAVDKLLEAVDDDDAAPHGVRQRAITLLHHLVALDVLGAREETRIRSAMRTHLADPEWQIARDSAMQLLASVADDTMVDALQAAITAPRSGGMERYYAADALKRLAPTDSAGAFAGKLSGARTIPEIEALCNALEIITGEQNNWSKREVSPGGGVSTTYPNGEQWRPVQRRWLDWWRVFGDEWKTKQKRAAGE